VINYILMDAQAIKALRLKMGLTQEDFAHRLGVTLPTVSRWEHGKSKPSRLAKKALEEVMKEVSNA